MNLIRNKRLTMCKKNFVFWLCLFFLLVTLASKSWQNSISNEDKNDDCTEKSINYTDNVQHNNTQYESRTTSTSNDLKDDDNKLSKRAIVNIITQNEKDWFKKLTENSKNIEIPESSRNIEDEDDSMSYKYHDNFIEGSNRNNIVPYEMCYNATCIQFCCPFGYLTQSLSYGSICVPANINYTLPNVYTNDLLQSENKKVDELFQLTIYNPCQINELFAKNYMIETFMIFANGSIYLPYYEIFVNSTSYCFAIVAENTFNVMICSETLDMSFDDMFFVFSSNNTFFVSPSNDISLLFKILLIISLNLRFVSLFLLMITFLVYSILPELRNVHGFMLRNYIGSFFVAFFINMALISSTPVQYSTCIIYAFFHYLFCLASYFWLIIMSFDMWRTFRGLCSLQRNIRQRKRNKYVFYMLFAWGLPLIFAIHYVIIEVVSEYLPEILRPKFREGSCRFAKIETITLYYYTLTSICVITSVCLSISTMKNIARYEKGTSDHLLGSENKQYSDNKKWFKLYQKLFIAQFVLMGLGYLITIASVLLDYYTFYNLYAIFLLDFVQKLCIFIIYVCKKEIMHMLLKRFSCGLFKKT